VGFSSCRLLPWFEANLTLAPGPNFGVHFKGRCIDNIFVERLWRSLKYEEIYLNAYDDLAQARKAIDKYMDFFNYRRQHQSLGYQTPDAVYTENMKQAA